MLDVVEKVVFFSRVGELTELGEGRMCLAKGGDTHFRIGILAPELRVGPLPLKWAVWSFLSLCV